MTSHFTLIKTGKYPILWILKMYNNPQDKHKFLNTDQFIANMRKFNQTFVNTVFNRLIL